MKKKIALVVGYSYKKQGAVNQETGLSEYKFNDKLVEMVKDKCPCGGVVWNIDGCLICGDWCRRKHK